MKKLIAVLLLGAVIGGLSVSVAEARGRTGSHRVGGYTSHGKGSHYIGGYVSAPVPHSDTVNLN